jgi:hypothetical protein
VWRTWNELVDGRVVKRWYGGKVRGCYVRVWATHRGWLANCDLRTEAGMVTFEMPVHASSPESALRSLLGVIGNAHMTLGKLLEPVRKGGKR